MANTEQMMTEQTTTYPEARDNGMLARLFAASIVAGIILLECTVAYLILPDPQALSEAVSDDAQQSDAQAAETLPLVEVPLGRFSMTKQRPENSTFVRIEFDVVYTVLKEDKQEFSKLLGTHANRLRDRIIFIVRKSEVSDLTDARLDLIKRRILETSNALFGKHYVHSVVFSEYAYIEQ